MRCTRAAQYAVVKALEDRSRSVNFYEINERRGRFQLSKHSLNLDELCVSLPQRALDLQEAFDEEPE